MNYGFQDDRGRCKEGAVSERSLESKATRVVRRLLARESSPESKTGQGRTDKSQKKRVQ